MTAEAIQAKFAENPNVWDAVVATFEGAFPDEHIEKVGFAREVVGVLQAPSEAGEVGLARAMGATRQRFRALLGHVAGLLRDARTTEDDVQQRDRVGRLVRGFLKDHSTVSPGTGPGCSSAISRRLWKTPKRAMRAAPAWPNSGGDLNSIANPSRRFRITASSGTT